MKLLLHIGTEKTGSTSIQFWLDENHRALVDAGIWFARSLGRPTNRRATAYSARWGRDPKGHRDLGIDGPEALAKFRARQSGELAREVGMAREAGCRVFVVSNEHLHSRLTDPEAVTKLRRLFAPHFDDVEVLCYLRPQATLLQSRLAMIARKGDSIEQYLSPACDDTYYNYHMLWRRWRARFDKVTLVPYRRLSNVVDDIASRLGADHVDTSVPDRRNERLDWRAALLLRNIVGSQEANAPSPNLHLELMPVEEPIGISRSLAERIANIYRTSNATLVAESGQLELNDLQADPHSFEPEGNVDQISRQLEGADFLSMVVRRLDAEIWFERARSDIAEAELGLARGRFDRGLRKLKLAERNLAMAEAAKLQQMHLEIERMHKRLARLRTRIKRGAGKSGGN